MLVLVGVDFDDFFQVLEGERVVFDVEVADKLMSVLPQFPAL